jgi:heme oxygenase
MRRFTLKHATSPAHRRLEADCEALALFTSRKRFGAFLITHLSAYRGFAAVAGPLRQEPWYPCDAQQRIEDDLAALFGPDHRPHRALSEAEPAGDLAAVAGTAYVLLGSLLGGTVILSQHGERLGISAHHGGRFLSLHRERPGAWTSFCDWLETVEGGDGACKRMIEAAHEMFAWYGAGFDNALAQPNLQPGTAATVTIPLFRC